MMRAYNLALSPRWSRRAVLLAVVSLLALPGWDDNGGDRMKQIGANPVLPKLQQYFIPPIRIARAVGWGKDETPTVPQGLQVHALADGFEHPRAVYVLPNGDVLGVGSDGPPAPISRPEDIITG